MITAATLAVWVTGCEEKKTDIGSQIKQEADKAGDAVKNAAESVKETGEKVAKDVADKAKEVTAAASAKGQELIDSAKSLVAEGKFQEAMDKLKAIGGEKLSVDQQAIVDNLKAQIEKALASGQKAATDAAGAAGNLLKK